MLAILAWWAIPVGAGVLATCCAAVFSRARRRSDALDGLQSHRRFRAALERDAKIGSRR